MLGQGAMSSMPKEPHIGLLKLDSQFPRIKGDIAHSDSFRSKITTRTINAATPKKVVHNQMDNLIRDFIEATIELEQKGANVITTSCGFLALYQTQLQNCVSVPVLSSALFLYEPLKQLLPADRNTIGLLTISRSSLSNRHLQAAGIPPDTAIAAPDTNGAFCQAILGNRPTMNIDLARSEVAAAAKQLVSASPNVNAIILECTNMPPYKAEIETQTGIAVYSLMDVLDELACGTSLRHSLSNKIARKSGQI